MRVRYVVPKPLPPNPTGRRAQRGNRFALEKAARKAQLARAIRDHARKVHAGQKVAPLKLGAIIYSEGEGPEFCDICGDAYVEKGVTDE